LLPLLSFEFECASGIGVLALWFSPFVQWEFFLQFLTLVCSK
jgi:hypothetical protein